MAPARRQHYARLLLGELRRRSGTLCHSPHKLASQAYPVWEAYLARGYVWGIHAGVPLLDIKPRKYAFADLAAAKNAAEAYDKAAAILEDEAPDFTRYCFVLWYATHWRLRAGGLSVRELRSRVNKAKEATEETKRFGTSLPPVPVAFSVRQNDLAEHRSRGHRGQLRRHSQILRAAAQELERELAECAARHHRQEHDQADSDAQLHGLAEEFQHGVAHRPTGVWASPRRHRLHRPVRLSMRCDALQDAMQFIHESV